MHLKLTTRLKLIAALTCLIFFTVAAGNLIFQTLKDPLQEDTILVTQTNKSVLATQQVHAAGIDYTRYTQTPFNLPTPNGESDIEFTPETMARLNTLGGLVNQYQSYLTSKHDAVLVDPFLSVIWNGAIEGLGGNQFFYNCYNDTSTLNEGCSGYSSGNWQVGWGVQVSQAAGHAVEDFNAAHGAGKADDASYVQSVGQAVITASAGKITNPSSFPNKSLTTLLNEANGGNSASRQAFAILLMDDKFGAIVLAREVASDIGSTNGDWASTMCGWGSYYCNGIQKFSNRAKAIADLYTGVAGASSGGGGGGSGSFTLNLVVRATDSANDSYVTNHISASATGGGGSSTGAGAPPGSVDAHCTPTGTYPSDPASELRSKYNITLDGYDAEGTKMIYEAITCVSNSKFPALLEGVTTTVHNSGSPRMSCDGDTCQVWMPDHLNAFKFILMHEFGHVLYYTNPRETMRVAEFENAWAKEGGLSPYSGPYKKDPSICGKSSMAEDYAELVTYYYNPNSGGVTGACDTRDNPPNSLFGTSDFPLHLEVAKQVL